ncbi:M20/M25/M40 family metallo-hydrolase, partial [bacterium]|nr:M20/M25/M40 family metallo-hydrolase [bacterium]
MKNLERQICSDTWISGEIINNHRELCLQYRGRFSASANAAGAANFIEQTLKRYGLDNTRREYFEMTTWARGTARLELLEPHRTQYPCIALPYAPSCNKELILVDADMGLPENLAAIPGGVAGKAVLVDNRNPPGGPGLHRLQKYLYAKQAGAAAFIFVQNTPGMLSPTGSLAFNHDGPLNQTIPAIGIPYEIAAEMREWASRDNLMIRLTMENTLARGRDCNVVADLSGASSNDDMIIICGHYDGHDIAQGAVDNASGTVAVMEAARLLAPHKNHLKCIVRFVLFGSEEMGLVGSHHMARAMANKTDKIRFVFNLDCVGAPGHIVMMLQNCPELRPFFMEQIKSLPSDIIINNHFVPFSDHFPFFLRGVPSAFLVTPGSGDRGWGHTIADTFEKVQQETLMR